MTNKINSIESAMNLFEEYSINHSNALEKGDYKNANKNYDKIIGIVSYLKKENAVDKLSILLSSSNTSVRLAVATFLLPINEKQSKNVLKEIGKTSGLLSLRAETILSEWEKGNLKL